MKTERGKQKAISLDNVARRYNCRPSDILQGSILEFYLDYSVAIVGNDAEVKELDRQSEKARRES